MKSHSCEAFKRTFPSAKAHYVYDIWSSQQWPLYLHSIANNFEAASSIRVNETNRHKSDSTRTVTIYRWTIVLPNHIYLCVKFLLTTERHFQWLSRLQQVCIDQYAVLECVTSCYDQICQIRPRHSLHQ